LIPFQDKGEVHGRGEIEEKVGTSPQQLVVNEVAQEGIVGAAGFAQEASENYFPYLTTSYAIYLTRIIWRSFKSTFCDVFRNRLILLAAPRNTLCILIISAMGFSLYPNQLSLTRTSVGYVLQY